MKNKYIVFVLLSISIFASACKSRKFMSAAKNEIMVVSEEELLKQNIIAKVPAANFDFNFLQSKAKVQANVKGKDYSLTFNIRMQKDKRIWISVNAIGSIEVARILITPDSVRIIDRINNQYLVKDFEFLSGMLNTNVDYAMIQNLMLGNAPLFNSAETLVLKQDELSYQLSAKQADIITNYTFRKEDTKLNEFSLEENTELKRNIRVNYSDYKLVENTNFPFLINSIASSQKESLKLNVQYTKVEKLNSLEFPFNVPKRFE